MNKVTLLGGLTHAQFMRKYWQKKPLLIRQAFPDFKAILKKNALFSLAASEDLPSRLITRKQKQWTLQEGPFTKKQLTDLQGIWTLLIQGVNTEIPDAQTILKQFNFIPHARLDDLMISYATAGGGVGPHLDSYDVFLLQAQGKRRWRISNQKDHTLVKNMPLKILKNFKPTEEWILEPGDMLYLPPNYAHDGVALDECMTYSIGFRAPSYQELSMQFLGHLQEHYQINGMYQDPDLQATKKPGLIDQAMLARVSDIIHQIQFSNSDIETFLGKYLTEPKPIIIFDSPEVVMSVTKFKKMIKQHKIELNLKSQMLYTKHAVFMNGECCFIKDNVLRDLANQREVQISSEISKELIDLLYHWYMEGYLMIKLES